MRATFARLLLRKTWPVSATIYAAHPLLTAFALAALLSPAQTTNAPVFDVASPPYAAGEAAILASHRHSRRSR